VSAIEFLRTVVLTSASTDLVQSKSRTRLYTFSPLRAALRVRGLRPPSLFRADWSEHHYSIRVCCIAAYTDISCGYTKRHFYTRIPSGGSYLSVPHPFNIHFGRRCQHTGSRDCASSWCGCPASFCSGRSPISRYTRNVILNVYPFYLCI